MLEDYEMYQAIHRVRPALKEKKVYVFGLVPEELFSNFPIKYIVIEKDSEGVMHVKEWKNFEQFVKEQIGDKGIFQYDLVRALCTEFGGQKEHTRVKVRRFIEKHNSEFEIMSKKVMGHDHPFIKRR